MSNRERLRVGKGSQHLVHVSPVLSAVVEAFPEHAHDLGERHHVEGQVSDLRHEGGGGPPWVVGGGLAHLHNRRQRTTTPFLVTSA